MLQEFKRARFGLALGWDEAIAMKYPAMRYEAAVSELEALGIMPEGFPHLDAMRHALERSGFLSRLDSKRNIIIAGTNGKGSAAATLSRLLFAAGRRVGLYTSPHLVTTTERFRVDEKDVSEEEFISSYLRLRVLIREEGLTHFEALTLIAVDLFFSGQGMPPVDYAIWEVGMGGLWDATNAIPHHYCAITKLGLDHQAVLGESLEAIAAQKFGVIQKGAIVAFSPMPPELASLRDEFRSRTGCQWIEPKPVKLDGLNDCSTSYGKARLSLCGPRAAENTALALTLFEVMGFDPTPCLHSLSQVRWPGRFSAFGEGRFPCPAFVSGDHNAQGVESLLGILESFSWSTLHLVVGIGRDKEAKRMLEMLERVPRLKLYLTETAFKPLLIDKYPERSKSRAQDRDPDVFRLLARIQSVASPEDLIVVTGSLYLVGKVLSSGD